MRHSIRRFNYSRLTAIVVVITVGLSAVGIWSFRAKGASSPTDFSALYVTEIMYQPINGPGYSPGEYEFLEVQNRGTTFLEIGGVSFVDGITLNISPGTQLAAGAFLVVAKNPAAFQERYGVLPSNDTGYGGQLSNEGEQLTLQDADGNEILSLTYSTDAPHLRLANGIGFSIVPIDPANRPMSADDWRVGSQGNGSPGQEDSVLPQEQPRPIKVNEVLAHTDPPEVDFIELYNPTDEIVDIGGWYITDRLGDPTRFRIPPGTQIQAGGYWTFDQNQLGFAFFSEGDGAYLLAADSTGNLIGYSHGFEFGVTPNGVSLGRCRAPSGRSSASGTIQEYFSLQESVTEGRQNEHLAVGPAVLSELMYASPSGDEFIEVVNMSAESLRLYDPSHPENLWRIDGVGLFTFTTHIEIPAGGTLLVTSIEPELFRNRYAIPDDIEIQGPFRGQLSDEGEKISLQMPDEPNLDGTVPYISVDVVEYGVTSPWPITMADGRSLERISVNEFGESPLNWRASRAPGGTPGEWGLATSIRASQTSEGSSSQPPHSISQLLTEPQNTGQILFLPFAVAPGQNPLDSCFRTLVFR